MKGVAFLSDLFCVLSGTTDGCTTRHMLLFCTIKMLLCGNIGVESQGTTLCTLASLFRQQELPEISSLSFSVSVVALGRLLTHVTKRFGPGRLPCGMPLATAAVAGRSPFTSTD